MIRSLAGNDSPVHRTCAYFLFVSELCLDPFFGIVASFWRQRLAERCEQEFTETNYTSNTAFCQ